MAGLDASIYGNQQIPQTMSLGDMVNIARGAQAYKQAQQINPIAVQTAQTGLEQAKTQLANTQSQIAGGALTGLENSASYQNNDPKGIKKELTATENWLKTINPDLLKPGGVVDQAHQLVDDGDIAGYKNLLANVRKGNASPAEQYAAALPQFSTNALGQQFLANRAAGTISAPQQQGTGNITPTAPGVQNFNQYQQDLTNRVAAGTQIDMRLNEAENLMQNFKPGAGSRTYVDMAQKLQAIGAPQDLVDKVAKGDLSAAQSLNKFIAQSVTAGIGQMQGNPTANMMNDYLKNNPDIGSDPRALQRFFDFAHKQNNMAYEEQQFLLDKTKSGQLNPDTHPAEAQQHILNTFVRPQSGKSNTITGGNQTPAKKVVKTGTYNGKKVVQYDDGSLGYQ